MRRWKGGSTMSTKASTAALDQMRQRLRLLQRRIPRHPAGGFWEAELMGNGGCEGMKSSGWGFKETTMKNQPVVARKMEMLGARRTIRRRFIAAVLLGAVSFVVPVV